MIDVAVSADIDLGQARARLAELEIERAALRERIASLERDAGGPDITSAVGRVALFGSLFRGREHVFATRWESTRTPGKSGWAPKCSNEWAAGLCFKPKVKCAACAHRRFVPFSAAEVRSHLEGRQTAGIYPLLADETCWLVAIDLDGQSWREDVRALRDAAGELDVPVLVERSRSGLGAHVWVLFSAPVPARSARRLGSLLLTRAMRHRTISMESYDRLCPSQDTMPAGGFGNLIALPLQRARRASGCTVFLDRELEPVEDQWGLLSSAVRMDRERVEELSGEAADDGGGLGMEPWRQKSLKTRPRPLAATDGSVDEVGLRLGGRVVVDCSGLPATLRDRLRRTAAFANPMFFEREQARLSTHNTPRMITCFEQDGDRLMLPRGCLDRVKEELAAVGIDGSVCDERSDGEPISATFTGTLTPSQQAAVDALAASEIGVLVAPPGAGKTVMGAALIAERGTSTLVLVHRRPLLEQWSSQLKRFLGIDPGDIGSSGRPPTTTGVDLAMIQSVIRRKDVDLTGYGHVVVDECHHVPAVSVEKLMQRIPARHITGLTATPHRRDGHDPIIAMQCGPVRHTVTTTERVETATRRVVLGRHTGFDVSKLPNEPSIQEVLGGVAGDADRTAQIARDVLGELEQHRYPLVLTERREHLAALAAALAVHTDRVAVLHGGIGIKARRRVEDMLASDGPRVVLATGRYIGEGFDDPRLDTLMLAMPIAWRGTMTQYAGRLHRHHDAKHEIRIIDYVDHAVPVLRRMYAKRQRAYASLGYRPG
jgi:superfamily II DNA or RNA helicase